MRLCFTENILPGVTCKYKEDMSTAVRLNENGFVRTVFRCAKSYWVTFVFWCFYFAGGRSSKQGVVTLIFMGGDHGSMTC